MPARLTLRSALLLWLLFSLICFDLGYPILNRYDPGAIAGTSDAAFYVNQVKNPLSISSFRPLVPALAKPFYRIADGRISSWNPALFGMLAAASILTAATSVIIVAIGLQSRFSLAASLVAALLFLVNFAVPNWYLSAYVDSGEALFLVLVAWSLLSARWWLLPLWAILGTLSKETFAPFAIVFAIVWWLSERPRQPRKLVWIAGLALVSFATVLLSFSSPGVLFSGATNYAAFMGTKSKVSFFLALIRCLIAGELWYTFIWLLPLGLLRLKRLDRRWIWATAPTFLLALLLGAYTDAQGNIARPLFSIAGPLLSLSAASLLTDSRFETT